MYTVPLNVCVCAFFHHSILTTVWWMHGFSGAIGQSTWSVARPGADATSQRLAGSPASRQLRYPHRHPQGSYLCVCLLCVRVFLGYVVCGYFCSLEGVWVSSAFSFGWKCAGSVVPLFPICCLIQSLVGMVVVYLMLTSRCAHSLLHPGRACTIHCKLILE